MRILPNFIYKPLAIKQNNRTDYSQYRAPVLTPLQCDTVTFQGISAKSNMRELKTIKQLLAYDIPDMYTGKPLIDPKEIREIMQAKIFSKPLKILVPFLANYEKSLFPVETEIFKMIKKNAKRYPNMKLEDIMHMQTADAMFDLRGEQIPILEELTRHAQQLPKPQLRKFEELMRVTESRLYDREILMPFSRSDLEYKLVRIMEGIKTRGIPQEISTMRKLIHMAKGLPRITTRTAGRFKQGKKQEISYPKFHKDNIPTVASRIKQMEKVISQSSLRHDRELNNLIKNSKMRLYGIPLVVPFGRKSFLFDLKEILKEVENPKLVRSLEKIAVQLPTAKEYPSAFIMKSSGNSSEKIGYDLIANSMGTVEHLIPQNNGGENVLSNFGLASALYNGERAHSKMSTQMKKHPEMYENCQKYVDRLIELYNDGTFKKIGLPKQYILSFVKKMYELSPKEKPMVLNIDKLK